MKSGHIIESIVDNSIASGLNIHAGDELVSINGSEIEDIFDYQYHCENEVLTLKIRHTDGSFEEYEVSKDEDEDIGIRFADGLMDDYRHCSNKCIFCFIDQMPKGMRDTLYFKDDDARLSFLQGNYITLTNMSEHDIDRIIKYRLSPINVSFQTMNPELRCKMLNNRFAGEALKKVDRLYEAGIEMNGQIVLCKGYNDGDELEYSISRLYEYLPVIRSVSVVPVGITKFREGLPKLELFDKDDAIKVISLIEKWQKKAYEEYGLHFIHASDEWYITAGLDLPEEERYDGYLQIENGVGMIRSLLNEFEDSLRDVRDRLEHSKGIRKLITGIEYKRIRKEKILVVTGRLVSGYIRQMADSVQDVFPQKEIEVLPIRNDFFGETITVTGLLTGQDIIAQCLPHMEGVDRIIMPENVLRAGTEVFLDDITLTEMRNTLHSRIDIVKSSGYDNVMCYLGIGDYNGKKEK
ncbi:MAG: DUF512 domain-containing protein [Lachnospiraceae bacterium]|nr:DUF512 domain-containing protein [Lachnospiraceae bacterium]